jgi:hypothetical protein
MQDRTNKLEFAGPLRKDKRFRNLTPDDFKANSVDN